MSSASLMEQVKKRAKILTATEENCPTKKSVEDFGSKMVSNSSGFSLDESEANSERATENGGRLYKAVGTV